MPEKKSPIILVVDDDPTILVVVKEQVSFYGYQPILASSGREALQAGAKHAEIHLLLTDIMMPGMNGIDLAIQFSALHPETAVLFMSGHMSPLTTHYAVYGSHYDFVQKPFSTKTLISKIKTALNRSNTQPKVHFDA